MARVQIETQAWGWLADASGNGQAGRSVQIKNTDGSNATHWSAITGGTSSTAAITTASDGTISGRYIEGGTYDLYVDGGLEGRIEAVPGADVRVLREAPINVRDPAYGAVGDGSSEPADTAAFAAAKTALVQTGNARGGKILVPPGDYRLSAGLNCDDTQGVTIEGLAGRATNQPRILFSPSTGSLITGKSSQGMTLRNLRLEYSHAAYAGDFLNFDHSVAATDVFFLVIENCWIGGVAGAVLANSLVRLNKTIISSVRNCRLIRGVVGVRGRNPDYSNAIQIEGCEFNTLSTAGVYNPGEGWKVSGCTFEPTSGGGASGIDHDFVATVQGIDIHGNWFGDVSTGAAQWIRLKALGLSIKGNRFASPGPTAGSAIMRLNTCEGVSIMGNRFEGGTSAIEFLTAASRGVMIGGNDFSGQSTPILKTVAPINYAILGNDGVPNEVDASASLGQFVELATAGTAIGSTAITGTTVGDKISLYNGGSGGRYGIGLQSGRLVLFLDNSGSGVAVRGAPTTGAGSSGSDGLLLHPLGYMNFPLAIAAASVPNNSIFRDSADNVLKRKDNAGAVAAI